MNKPLISIVVPIYNLENYITRTLDSIFEQTYLNIEVIAVDDGSNDNSGKILDEYAQNERRLIVIHKANGGVTSARIKGIEMSSGDYIGFVDGDDLIDADMYERLLNNALDNDADISHCGYRLIKENEVDYYYNTGKKVLQNNKHGLVDLILGKFVEPGLCNKLFRRELFYESNFCELNQCQVKNNEDLLMNYYLFKKSRCSVYEDFCPYQYIVRKGSASKREANRNTLMDPIKVAEKIYSDCKDDEQLRFAAAELLVTKLITAASYYKFSSDTIIDCRREARLKLKAYFLEITELKMVSNKIKLKAFLCVVSPKSYFHIHNIYLKHS